MTVNNSQAKLLQLAHACAIAMWEDCKVSTIHTLQGQREHVVSPWGQVMQLYPSGCLAPLQGPVAVPWHQLVARSDLGQHQMIWLTLLTACLLWAALTVLGLPAPLSDY